MFANFFRMNSFLLIPFLPINIHNHFSVSWIFWVWLHNFWSELLWRIMWLRWVWWICSKSSLLVDFGVCYFFGTKSYISNHFIFLLIASIIYISVEYFETNFINFDQSYFEERSGYGEFDDYSLQYLLVFVGVDACWFGLNELKVIVLFINF